MPRDRSASPKRHSPKPEWFKPGVSTKALVYFHIALLCDTPILEALFRSNAAHNLVWSGVDADGMSRYFFDKMMEAFERRFTSPQSWTKRTGIKPDYPIIVQWEKGTRLIEFVVRRIPPEKFTIETSQYVTHIALYEGRSETAFDRTGVGIQFPDKAIAVNPEFAYSGDEGDMYTWSLPCRSELEKFIVQMVVQFYAKYKAFFERS